MQLNYGQVKVHSSAITAAIADARSARNLASRRRSANLRDDREAEYHRRRRKWKSDRELEDLLRLKVRIKMPTEERPRIGPSTARKLYHRTIDTLIGTAGLRDARGLDGLYSIHFAFVARGFASTKERRWRRGEAERAARYIVREDGLEGGECGWWSSIADDRNELVAFYRTLEALERHDRSNANVYITEIISLPFELSARQRRKVVRRICRFFDERGLPYTAALHLPDKAGDQRNYHVHLMYSLRPCVRVGAYDWNFGVGKEPDINTPTGIRARRLAVVQAINVTLCAAGCAKRYSHLSNRARGMATGEAKTGQKMTWVERRLKALEKQMDQLQQLSAMVASVRNALGRTGLKLQREKANATGRLRELGSYIGMVAVYRRAAVVNTVATDRLAARAQTVSHGLMVMRRQIGEARVRGAVTLGGKGTRLGDKASGRQRRATMLGATATIREKSARLLARGITVRQRIAAYENSTAESGNAVSSSLAAMRAAIERGAGGHVIRLGSLIRLADRTEMDNRLNVLSAALGRSISNATPRVREATRTAQAWLGGVRQSLRTLEERRTRWAKLRSVAELRHRDEQQRSDAANAMVPAATSVEPKPVTARQADIAAPGQRIDDIRRSHSGAAARTTLPASGDVQRGSERRRSIAAAAWRLRRSPFPPQVQTATGISISPQFLDNYREVDRFEAESAIQKMHQTKRLRMLTAVRREVEGLERSPFTERDGLTQLSLDIFDQPLRRAVKLAINDADLIQALDRSLLFWRKREADARKARARKEHDEAERRDRMRPDVQKVFDAVKQRMQDGRCSQSAVAAIWDDVLAVAKAVGEGRLAKRHSGADHRFRCASEELPACLDRLAKSPIGREIITALGELTLNEPFEPVGLSFG